MTRLFQQSGGTAAESVVRLRQLALDRYSHGAYIDAEVLYERVLGLNPTDFESLVMLGVLSAQQRQFERAATLLRRAIASDPNSPQAHNNLGIVFTELNRSDEAIGCFDQALALDPGYAEAHANRAAAMARIGRFEEALRCCDTAIALSPRSAAAQLNRASLLRRMGFADEALLAADRALSLEPNSAQTHIVMADLLREAQHFDEAMRCLDRACTLQPDCPQAFASRGTLLLALQRPQEALAAFDRAIVHQPGEARVHSDRAAVLLALCRPASALDTAERALALDGGLVAAHVNRGIALQDLLRPEEALQSFATALGLDPTNTDALHNRASALQELARFEDALAGYDACLALQPSSAEAAFNKGICLLLNGDYEQGWKGYESRLRGVRSLALRAAPLACRPWRGEELRGKTLFLWWEQGLGDTLQFCRYAKLLQVQHGAHVILEVQPGLRELVRSVGADVEVVADNRSAERADYHCPLLSVPARLGTLQSPNPEHTPYLAAAADRIDFWRQRLGAGGFKIGVCWQGALGKADVGRSFALEHLRPIAQIEGVRLISLQRHTGLEQLSTKPADLRIEILGQDFDQGPHAFLDCAAVLHSLDLVIAPDTAVAHLAGALARPAWLALKRVPDWRWGALGNQTRWYRSLRLFRQPRYADWNPVFEQMTSQVRIAVNGTK